MSDPRDPIMPDIAAAGIEERDWEIAATVLGAMGESGFLYLRRVCFMAQ